MRTTPRRRQHMHRTVTTEHTTQSTNTSTTTTSIPTTTPRDKPQARRSWMLWRIVCTILVKHVLDIDFARVHAASESYCTSEKAASVSDSPTFATRIGEDRKAQKYAQLCASRGHILLPVVLNTYGGFGEKIMQVVDKHFDAKRAEEFEKTGQEWTSLGERDLPFQRGRSCSC